MSVNPLLPGTLGLGSDSTFRFVQEELRSPTADAPQADDEPSLLRDKFQEFVAGTFFATLLKSLRKTVPQGSLMHGGRAEEIFQAQLDQTLVEKFASSNGSSFSDQMFEQFVRVHHLNEAEQRVRRDPADEDRATGAAADRPPQHVDRVI